MINNATLIYNPLTDVIDLDNYTIYDETHIEGNDYWKLVDLTTTDGNETYRVITTAETENNVKGLNDIPKDGDDGKYILNSDIDLELTGEVGSRWIKIGCGISPTNAFAGIFTGNGHKILNLYINATDNINGQEGLFGSTYNSKISNLCIESGNVINNSEHIYSRTGSIVGVTVGLSTINNCCSKINITSTKDYVGGIVGYNYSISTISNCYYSGDIVGAKYIGGIAGGNSNSEIMASISNSTVTGTSIIGGIVGTNINSSIVSKSYWNTNKTLLGYGSNTGTFTADGLTNDEMQDSSNYTDWNFKNIWAIDDSYPYLRMQVNNLANPISNSRIVNNYDGYIILPTISAFSQPSIFDRSNQTIYNGNARGELYNSSEPTMWHLSELNTNTIISYMNLDYRYIFFAKNSFDSDGNVLTIKEMFLYNTLIDSDADKIKIRKYLGLSGLYKDVPTFDDNPLVFKSIERVDGIVKNKLDATGDSDGQIVGKKYLHFDTTNSSYGMFQNMNTSSLEFRCEFIIRVNSSSDWQRLIQIGSTSSFITFKPISNNLTFRSSSSYQISPNESIRIGSIQHIVVERDENGLVTATIDDIEYPDYSKTNTDIGNYFGLSNQYSGYERGNFDIFYIKYQDNNNNFEYDFSCGDKDVQYSLIDGKELLLYNNNNILGVDLTNPPLSVNNGFSIIDGYDGEIPPLLSDPSLDCVTRSPLTNPATSKIVSNVDGYIILPDITIDGYGSLFDKHNTAIYLDNDTETFSTYNTDNYFLWHINELTTESIQKHLKEGMKFLWFAKNNYNNDGSVKEVISIFSYSKPITNESQQQLVQFYLNESLWNITE